MVRYALNNEVIYMSLQRESLLVYNETDTCMAMIRVFMLYETNNLAYTSVFWRITCFNEINLLLIGRKKKQKNM